MVKKKRTIQDSIKPREGNMADTAQPTAKVPTVDPNARILEALKSAVSGVVDPARDDSVAKAIAMDLQNFLDSQVPATPKIDDPCIDPVPEVAPFCVQRRRARTTAKNTFDSSKLAATNSLRAAINTWEAALNEYDFEMANAKVQFKAAQKAASETLGKKVNKDSTSRDLFLYYSMEQTVAAAVQALETSAAAAASTLAGAAGALLGAYAAYMAAIDAAQSQLMTDSAAAEQSFWQNVEDALDS